MELGEYDELSNCNVFNKLHKISNELNILLIGTLQLDDLGIRVPKISDLRQPFDVEKEADVIIFLNRPESQGLVEDAKGNSTVGIVEIEVSKHLNGRIGKEKLNFNSETGSFSEKPFE